MSASLPRQACARQDASSSTNRATSALRHGTRAMQKQTRHEPKAGAALGERAPQGGALAHGRRTEPVARRRRLEPQPRRANTTREHSTKHNSGETGNERRENHLLAPLGGSPLAEGRAACTNDREPPRPRTSLFRRTRCGRHCTRLRLRTPLPTCEPPNVGHERRLEACEHAGRRPLDGRVRPRSARRLRL